MDKKLGSFLSANSVLGAVHVVRSDQGIWTLLSRKKRPQASRSPVCCNSNCSFRTSPGSHPALC